MDSYRPVAKCVATTSNSRTRPKHSEIQIVPELTRGQKWRCDRLKARRESVMGGVAKSCVVRSQRARLDCHQVALAPCPRSSPRDPPTRPPADAVHAAGNHRLCRPSIVASVIRLAVLSPPLFFVVVAVLQNSHRFPPFLRSSPCCSTGVPTMRWLFRSSSSSSLLPECAPFPGMPCFDPDVRSFRSSFVRSGVQLPCHG